MQRRQHLLFTQEPVAQLRRKTIAADHLDGYTAIERLLHGLVNLSHAADPQLPHDAEIPEPRWMRQGGGRREAIQRPHQLGVFAQHVGQARIARAVIGLHLLRIDGRFQLGHEGGEDRFLRALRLRRLVHGRLPSRMLRHSVLRRASART
jgi:hypothetical protein